MKSIKKEEETAEWINAIEPSMKGLKAYQNPRTPKW
jgi:hypothetical protein